MSFHINDSSFQIVLTLVSEVREIEGLEPINVLISHFSCLLTFDSSIYWLDPSTISYQAVGSPFYVMQQTPCYIFYIQCMSMIYINIQQLIFI